MLDILKVPDKRLLIKAKPVDVYTKLMKAQIAEMQELVGENLGLAATQVGIDRRFFITNFEGEVKVFMNPIILYKSGLLQSTEECLSVPGIKGRVTRAKRIVMEAFDETCSRVKIKAEGIYAILLQHECDHLDGILFTSKLKKFSS